MWVVESLGLRSPYNTVRPVGYIHSKSLQADKSAICVDLRNTETGEYNRLDMHLNEVVDTLGSYRPYGLFRSSDVMTFKDGSYALVAISKKDLQFLEYVDIVEYTNSTVEPVVFEFRDDISRLFGAKEYMAVDNERSVFCSDYQNHSLFMFKTIFQLATDNSGAWIGDCLYILKAVVNNVFFAYRVTFKDVVSARRMVTKAAVLRG